MNAREKLGLLAMIVLCLTVMWSVRAAEEAPQELKPAAPQHDRASPTQLLGGEERYLTHISTDKPIYRPGETLYVRGVMLHHLTNKPLNNTVTANVEVIGPKGDTVASGHARTQDSVLAFSWKIPDSQAGGEYTVKISHPWAGHAPAERKFDIRAYRAPRLKSQIHFIRDGYGPGDKVVARLEVERAEGGVPAGAKVTVIARVDGEEAYRGDSQVDEHGRCIARFELPEKIARGEGTLAMVIEDGGAVETASKTIPILLQTVDLTMYPEGGDLIAGVENRVYFEAFTPAKKPADLEGVIVDSDGQQVARFRSEHEGRGRFSLTPAAGEEYAMKITKPSGINTTYPLPEAKPTGVAMIARRNVFDGSVEIDLASPQAQDVTVTLNKRGKELAQQQVALPAGEAATVKLPAGEVEGTLIATVYDDAGQPLAERLVFRKPDENIRVEITANKDQYVPGGKAKLTIKTTDADGKPISSIVGVTVTDDSVLEMIEKRDQAPRLPAMVLLENDVQELADAHVYLNPESERGPLAVDLLLGTQGWRRFALLDVTKFAETHGDPARRALAMRVVTRREREERHLLLGVPEAKLKGQAVPQAARLGEADKVEKAVDEAKENAPPPEAPDPAAPVPAKPAQAQGQQPQAEAANGARARPDVAQDALPRADAKQQELGKALDRAAAAEPQLLEAVDARRRLRRGKNDFVAVREYAHQVRPDRQPSQRSDFTETLYWAAGVKTNEQGEATVEFGLSDAVTSFRVTADAFSRAGALGTADTAIESVEPFYVEPKLPLEVTSGDTIYVPLSLANATGTPLTAQYTAGAGDLKVENAQGSDIMLPPEQSVRRFIQVRVGDRVGPSEFTLSAKASGFEDKVTRNLSIKPLGFPVERGQGGLIDSESVARLEIDIPESVVPGSIDARAVVYPTPLASMTEALERLIRDPNGCFEQTSSTTYPLVMAQQYFMSHQGVDSELIERSSEKLEKGYNRLIGFECKNGGFEWFGKDPGHDALTAYGLLEFTDMAQVRHVDPAMLERTRKWLLDQRDGQGGYERKTRTLHTWLPEPEVSNTYNTWALLEAGVDADLSTEVAWIREAAQRTTNTYVKALAANVFALAGDRVGEEHMLDALAGKQTEDGSLEGATVSVVGSGGESLKIETTALAVLAWLKNPRYALQAERGIKFLAETCKSGRFGGTQSTVLALRAIVAYDKARAKPKADGSLQLVVDGKNVGEPVQFTKDDKGAIELPAFAEHLTPGAHTVEVKMADGSQMPFSIAVNYHNLKPDSSDDCKLHMDVALADAKIREGEVTEARVSVVNRTNETVPTPLAIVGIPGGMEVRHEQLKELVKAEKIAAYEVLGRDVVLYWRAMKPEERVDIPVSLVAAVPGKYTAPASRAYLYYTDEHKTWLDGLQAEITPRD